MMSVTNAQLLEDAVKALEKAGVEDAVLNARELLGKVLSCDCRSFEFGQKLNEQAETSVQSEFESLCERRISGEPLQYLIGEWEFYGLTLKVGEGVLIPRQDTETLVDTVLKKAPKDDPLIAADLCAGSGCIALALEKHLSFGKIYAVEKSPEAMSYLEHNIKLNNSAVVPVLADVTDEQTVNGFEMLDVIVSNPPYLTKEDMQALQKEVTFEPQSALFGGDDGLEFYRTIIRLWKSRLKQGGLIAFEIGADMQDEVMTMLVRHGFENVRAAKDACGIFRCVTGFKK